MEDVAIQIFEKHIGINAEHEYEPIKKEDVMDAIREALIYSKKTSNPDMENCDHPYGYVIQGGGGEMLCTVCGQEY